MSTKAVALMFLFLSSLTFADTRSDKVKALMEAEGVLEFWTQLIAVDMQQNRIIAQEELDKKLSQLNPDETFKERYTTALNKFMANFEAAYTAKEISDVWAKFYGPAFTDDELDQLITFYRSPLGQKEIQAKTDAFVFVHGYIRAAVEPKIQAAQIEYAQDLELITSECKCAE